MNYSELRTLIGRYLHRSDLDDRIREFIARAESRINQRFGASLVPLAADQDTNEVLGRIPELYIYAALADGYAYLDDAENQKRFDDMFSATADRQNILSPGLESLDPYHAGDDGRPLRVTATF